jgi:hypothetical protein
MISEMEYHFCVCLNNKTGDKWKEKKQKGEIIVHFTGKQEYADK